MKSLIFIGVFAGMCFSSSAQDIRTGECLQMRKGEYMMEAEGGGDIYIYRRRNKQIERYLTTGKKYVFAIEWTGDCSYVLTFVRGNSKRDKQFKGKKVRARIIDFAYDTYTCVLTDSEGNEKKVEITIR